MKFTLSWLKYFLDTDATGALSLPLTGRVPGAARRTAGGVTLARISSGEVI